MKEDCVFPSKIIVVQEIKRNAFCKSCRKGLEELKFDTCRFQTCGFNQVGMPCDKKYFSVEVCVNTDRNVLKVIQEEFHVLLKYFNKDKEASFSLVLSRCQNSEIICALLSLQNIKLACNTKTMIVRLISFDM